MLTICEGYEGNTRKAKAKKKSHRNKYSNRSFCLQVSLYIQKQYAQFLSPFFLLKEQIPCSHSIQTVVSCNRRNIKKKLAKRKKKSVMNSKYIQFDIVSL